VCVCVCVCVRVCVCVYLREDVYVCEIMWVGGCLVDGYVNVSVYEM
jgi:hypothetical protein